MEWAEQSFVHIWLTLAKNVIPVEQQTIFITTAYFTVKLINSLVSVVNACMYAGSTERTT